MNLTLSGPMWHWRGPAPHYFVTVPEAEAAALKDTARLVTYGWGMIPVTVGVASLEYDTSLFPKDGGYIVPIRADARTALGLQEGQDVTIRLGLRSGKASRTVRTIQ